MQVMHSQLLNLGGGNNFQLAISRNYPYCMPFWQEEPVAKGDENSEKKNSFFYT